MLFPNPVQSKISTSAPDCDGVQRVHHGEGNGEFLFQGAFSAHGCHPFLVRGFYQIFTVYHKEKHLRREFKEFLATSCKKKSRRSGSEGYSLAGKGNAVFLGDRTNLLHGQLVVLGSQVHCVIPPHPSAFGTNVRRNTTAVIADAKVSSRTDIRDSSILTLFTSITPLSQYVNV